MKHDSIFITVITAAISGASLLFLSWLFCYWYCYWCVLVAVMAFAMISTVVIEFCCHGFCYIVILTAMVILISVNLYVTTVVL